MRTHCHYRWAFAYLFSCQSPHLTQTVVPVSSPTSYPRLCIYGVNNDKKANNSTVLKCSPPNIGSVQASRAQSSCSWHCQPALVCWYHRKNCTLHVFMLYQQPNQMNNIYTLIGSMCAFKAPNHKSWVRISIPWPVISVKETETELWWSFKLHLLDPWLIYLLVNQLLVENVRKREPRNLF